MQLSPNDLSLGLRVYLQMGSCLKVKGSAKKDLGGEPLLQVQVRFSTEIGA